MNQLCWISRTCVDGVDQLEGLGQLMALVKVQLADCVYDGLDFCRHGLRLLFLYYRLFSGAFGRVLEKKVAPYVADEVH